jgi:hypothetical protein
MKNQIKKRIFPNDAGPRQTFLSGKEEDSSTEQRVPVKIDGY